MSLANYAANIAEDDTFEAQHDELRSALDAKVIKKFQENPFYSPIEQQI